MITIELKKAIKKINILDEYDISVLAIKKIIEETSTNDQYIDFLFDLVYLSFKYGYIQGYRHVRDKGIKKVIDKNFNEVVDTNNDITNFEKTEIFKKLICDSCEDMGKINE
ncbi:hypothetical protein [Helcococcus kunzii]|uniref:hypothetical protein n=1 Tax=Helcococcus kunzii TaxID=40091 RepID=UPI0024ACC178|nr:hypothetical protein [Helcococcus kunzii]